MKQIMRKYHLFDAKGLILGRLSTEIANILSGKNRVDFSPHEDLGDFVVVVNVDKIGVTGSKEKKKWYYSFSGYPGGIHSISLEKLRKKDPRKILQSAVYGMLPKNKLRDKRMARFKVYAGQEHPHKTIHIVHK